METKKKSAIIKTIVCVIIMAALVVGYYIYISNKNFKTEKSKEEKKENIETLLARDLEKTIHPAQGKLSVITVI